MYSVSATKRFAIGKKVLLSLMQAKSLRFVGLTACLMMILFFYPLIRFKRKLN